jgi:hypothetical protein
MIENLSPGGNGGDATDEKAKVSANDTTAGFLNGKLVAGTNVTFTENNDGGNETLTIAAAGGVTGFTGSQTDTSPNNTVNASRLLVDATSTNADFVVQPKGTGALLAQLPDATATGGNKRGASAVDLQRLRTTNTQVASGLRSVIIGGQNNTASGADAVAIGNSNSISGTEAVAIGFSNTVAFGTGVIIGNSNTCSSEAIAMGWFNNMNRGSRNILIGSNARSTSSTGAIIHASGQFASAGDAQREEYVCRRGTTNATQTELTADGAAPFTAGSATNRVLIDNDSTYVFHIMVVARNAGTDNESAGYRIEGVIDNNANTTAFVGTPTVTVLSEDVAAWDVTVAANNTTKNLQILVTGEAGKTINWVAALRMVKVTG